MTSIGFIGLGVMGTPMARHLLRAGYELVVHARRPEAAKPLVSEGATMADTPAELTAHVDVVLTCLGDDRDVADVVLGEIIPATRAEQVLIDLTTSSPTLARELAAQADRRGVDVLDAPVSGGQVGAEEATLAIMVGGEVEAFHRAEPLLRRLGTPSHVGPAGSGQVAKAANQIIVGTTIAAIAEALLLAERAGADAAAVRRALRGGFADSRILQVHGQRMLDADFEPGFRSELHAKDLRLALELGRDTKTPLPTTSTVSQLFAALTAAGDGGQDHAAVQRALRRLVGERL